MSGTKSPDESTGNGPQDLLRMRLGSTLRDQLLQKLPSVATATSRCLRFASAQAIPRTLTISAHTRARWKMRKVEVGSLQFAACGRKKLRTKKIRADNAAKGGKLRKYGCRSAHCPTQSGIHQMRVMWECGPSTQ
jgi:hypothetical protein